jgi:hypothetical protein
MRGHYYINRATLRRNESRLVFIQLTIASLVVALIPLLFNEVPPLVDYPNHLARGVVLHGGERLEISRFYVANWAVIPNLGSDILLMGLLRLFEPALAGRVLLGLVIGAEILGIVLYSRVAFGRWNWWSLGAILAAYNGLFLFGFVNFCLSCGLAFLVGAAWRAFRETRPFTATFVAGLGIIGIWFTHLGGAIFALLLIGAHEATVIWRDKASSLACLPDRRRSTVAANPAPWRARLVGSRLPSMLALVTILLVLCLVSDISGADRGLEWNRQPMKWGRLLLPIASYYPCIDLVVALCPVTILALAAAQRGLKFDHASVLACAASFLLFVFSPMSAGSIHWIDVRFAAMAWMLFFASFVPTLHGRLLAGSAMLLAGAAAVKVVVLTLAWSQAGQDIAETRRVLSCVPAGARVVSALSNGEKHTVKRYRELAFIHYGVYDHLGAWAVIDEDAFWPGLFAYRGQHPLALKPTYAATVPTSSTLESLLEKGQGDQPPRLTALARTFDFVLVSGEKASAPEQLEGVKIEASSGFSALLRVAGSIAPKSPCR